MNVTIVYTDGACLGNPGPGGWGVRIRYPDGSVRESGGREASTTNNRMELQAAIGALTMLERGAPATIYSDSRYLLDGLTKWLPGWRQRHWLTAANTPVKNRDLWHQLDVLNRPGITWQHIRGHSGHPDNERVDAIAKSFAMGDPLPLINNGAEKDDPLSRHDDAIQKTPMASPASPPPCDAGASEVTTTPHRVQYVSLVHGAVVLDTTWPACAARVRGVPGARYKKVRTLQELVAFCAEHGIELPPDI